MMTKLFSVMVLAALLGACVAPGDVHPADQGAAELGLDGDACACETTDCVRDWVEENLGCGLCAAIVCDGPDWDVCVLCEGEKILAGDAELVEILPAAQL